MPTVLVHDSRLQGPTPTSLADYSFDVDAKFPIAGLIQAINGTAASTISRLMIMCHGYESTDTGSACIPMSLGFGLQLCMEDLTLANVSVMNSMYDCVEDIILYACGPANTAPFANGTYGDGRRFCSEMAAYTNANVYASDVTQNYDNLRYDPTRMVCEVIPIDFGQWEGNVYRFSPDGKVTRVQ
jgi:hypothetical protein